MSVLWAPLSLWLCSLQQLNWTASCGSRPVLTRVAPYCRLSSSPPLPEYLLFSGWWVISDLNVPVSTLCNNEDWINQKIHPVKLNLSYKTYSYTLLNRHCSRINYWRWFNPSSQHIHTHSLSLSHSHTHTPCIDTLLFFMFRHTGFKTSLFAIDRSKTVAIYVSYQIIQNKQCWYIVQSHITLLYMNQTRCNKYSTSRAKRPSFNFKQWLSPLNSANYTCRGKKDAYKYNWTGYVYVTIVNMFKVLQASS